MRLKANPLAAFERGDSPLAVHARRRWMKGGRADEELARSLCARIRADQSEDGSWGGSAGMTIRNLFCLWLLWDKPDAATGRALNWLLETHREPFRYQNADGASYDDMLFRTPRLKRPDLLDVPFTQGCSGFVKTGAALFLASVYGQGDAQRTASAFRTIEQLARRRNGRFCSGTCGSNLVLAIAQHPVHSRGAAAELAARWLATQQADTGGWNLGIPFFPTFYALSRLECTAAEDQFERALIRLWRTQKADGSWGQSQRLVWTWLALDALERKGYPIQ